MALPPVGPTQLFQIAIDRARYLVQGPVLPGQELPPAQSQTPENWEGLRRVFYTIAHDPQSNTRPAFMEFSTWFGTAEHYEGVKPQEDRGIRIVTPMEFPIEVPEGIDPLRFGALFLAYAMADEPPPIEVGLAKYFAVDPELRTHQTDTMLVVEQLLGAILALNPDRIDHEILALLRNPILMEFLETAFLDLNDLMVERDSLPTIQYNTIINRLWHGLKTDVQVYRAHINMTSLNELDPTNTQGSIYLAAVKKWLQNKFGESNIVQNPERTSFQFMGVDETQVRTSVANFELEVKAMMRKMPGANRALINKFTPQIWVAERSMTTDNIPYYAIATPADLELFRSLLSEEYTLLIAAYDASTITFTTFRNRLRGVSFAFAEFMDGDATQPSRLPLLRGLMTNALVNFNVELAAETTFFEKNYPYQENLYTERMLNTHLAAQAEQRKIWESYVQSRRGYVGVGQYDPLLENPALKNPALFPTASHHYLGRYGLEKAEITGNPDLDRLLQMLPRLKHVAGFVSHVRPGSRGALQRMGDALETFTSSATADDTKTHLAALKTVTQELRAAFRTVYGHAVTSPRHTWNMKHYQTASIRRGEQTYYVNSDLFVQEVAADNHTSVAVVELDSFKAHNARHLSDNPVDPDINGIQDQIYETAAAHHLPHPQVDPTAGDHFSFAFTTAPNLSASQFGTQVQEGVKTRFADKPFQDYHKVTMELHTFDITDPSQRLALQNENNLENLRTTLNLSARPVFVSTHADKVVMAFPRMTKDKEVLSQENISTTLIENGTQLHSINIRTETQILRLPIWRPAATTDTDVNPAELVFANTAPEGFEPFQRTLTISMVVGNILPRGTFRTPGEFRTHLDEMTRLLDHRLARLKEHSWPFKGGLEMAYRTLLGGTRGEVFFGPASISHNVSLGALTSPLPIANATQDTEPDGSAQGMAGVREGAANDLITPPSQYAFVHNPDGTVSMAKPETNRSHVGASLGFIEGGKATKADRVQRFAYNRNQWEVYLGAIKKWREELALTPETGELLDQLASGEITPNEILDMDNPENDFLESIPGEERDVIAGQLQEIHDTMSDLDYEALLIIARIEMDQPHGLGIAQLYERQYQPVNQGDVLPFRPRVPANTARPVLATEILIKA